MTQLTLNLRDEIARQAQTLAALEGKAVEEFLAGVVEQNLAEDPEAELRRLATLSDEDVLALADLAMTPHEDERLVELLEANSEGRLTPAERQELDALVRLNTEGMLKKSLGWAEAARRGLRQAPAP